jgi:ferritin-like metal-binding protein YciE
MTASVFNQTYVEMEGNRMQLASLQELFTNELKDLYDAEKQILKELPKMVDAASSPKLQKGFQQHLEQTRKHVERLDQIFQSRQLTAGRKKCKGIEGILEEGGELLKQDADPDVLDAGLIAAAQKVEHYEIAGYGSVRTYAELLGDRQAAALLEQTLQEEKATDAKLSELARNEVNLEAADADAEDVQTSATRRPARTAKK